MLEPGTKLGAYVVVNRLGAGGMGEVYLADDARLGRKAAIKILPPQFGQDDEHVRRFEDEARSASTLNHPNIVTIYDIGEASGVRFIAMEYVAGRTLTSFCGDQLPVETVRHWGAQLAWALDVAHAAGIVHRDVKPDNVIVRDDGYVKLLDFGVARLTRSDQSGAEAVTAASTNPNLLVGTLRYMAPEQLEGKPATPAADVFALGLVFYELVTGRHPIGAETLMELVRRLATEMPGPPSRLAPAVPPAFDELVLRMLAKDPEERPGAGDVGRALGWMGHAGPPRTNRAPPRPARPVTVGRERERQVLRDALASAIAGRGSLVCVAGEPGIGKTTLVEDVLAECGSLSPAWRVARGRCSERLAGTEAYLPWLEALDWWRRGQDGESTLQAIRRIAPTWYAQVAREANADATLLEEIRSASQERLKREFGLLIEELTNRSPEVLFFDDIHWADASTVDLLGFVATRLHERRLLIIVTYRPTDLQLAKHPFLQIRPDLQARGVCRELLLDFLPEQAIRAYLDLEYPGHCFPPPFAALIHARTEGSPLFMADLIRDLRDGGVIAREGETWMLARPLPTIERDLPESVRGMIERKISQLRDEDRELLVAASVHGARFDSAIVARAIGVDQATFEDRMESLERVHAFVHCLGDEQLPDRTLTLRYGFVHVLYQGALYGSLRATRRAALSGAVADAIRAAYGDHVERVTPVLASLAEASRNYQQAAEYFLRAARHASRMFASHEAIALAGRGLEVAALLPDSPQRARVERDLQVALGWPLINVRGYAAPEVEHAYTRARLLHSRTGDEAEPYEALWGLAMCYLARAQYARTCALGDEIRQLADTTRSAGALVTAHYMLGTVYFYLGELVASRTHYEQGIALSDTRPDLVLPDGRDPGVSCRAQIGRVLWLLGYPEQARVMTETALAKARRAEQPLALAFALFLEMLRRQMSRDVAGTASCSEELLALAKEHDLAQYGAWAGIVRGWALAAGDAVAGLEHIQQSLAQWERLGSPLSRPHFLALLAEILGAVGRVDEGLAVIEDALASAERTDERYYQPELKRLLGELSRRSSDPERRAGSTEWVTRAILEAQRQGARSWELRASVSLARSPMPHVTVEEALARVTAVYRSFTEGFDQEDLSDARALLES